MPTTCENSASMSSQRLPVDLHAIHDYILHAVVATSWTLLRRGLRYHPRRDYHDPVALLLLAARVLHARRASSMRRASSVRRASSPPCSRRATWDHLLLARSFVALAVDQPSRIATSLLFLALRIAAISPPLPTAAPPQHHVVPRGRVDECLEVRALPRRPHGEPFQRHGRQLRLLHGAMPPAHHQQPPQPAPPSHPALVFVWPLASVWRASSAACLQLPLLTSNIILASARGAPINIVTGEEISGMCPQTPHSAAVWGVGGGCSPAPSTNMRLSPWLIMALDITRGGGTALFFL